MRSRITRRDVLASAVVAAGVVGTARAEEAKVAPFGYCLNTSTLRGQNLPLTQLIAIAAKTGFKALEPWLNEIEKHLQSGGSLVDLRKQIEAEGLKIPSAIGFAPWIVDDDTQRAQGMEQMKRDMDQVAQIGGSRIAAPPFGLPREPAPLPTHEAVVERYREVIALGKKMGVTPELELWGFARTLHRLGDVAAVAIDAGEGASLLLDIYHLYKGGSDFAGLAMLQGQALGVVHTNDYPDLPREKIDDSYRVYPGDGVAPLGKIFRTLKAIGWTGFLSVELFNKSYWKQSPEKVAREALAKTKQAVERAND